MQRQASFVEINGMKGTRARRIEPNKMTKQIGVAIITWGSPNLRGT